MGRPSGVIEQLDYAPALEQPDGSPGTAAVVAAWETIAAARAQTTQHAPTSAAEQRGSERNGETAGPSGRAAPAAGPAGASVWERKTATGDQASTSAEASLPDPEETPRVIELPAEGASVSSDDR